MSTDIEKAFKRPGWFGVGAVLTAIGASVCCIGPLVLLSLGIGGAWVSTLTSMEAVRPFFLIATLVFIGLAFRKLFLLPDGCETGEACATPSVKRNQRVLFWVSSIFLIGLLAFPWYAPFFIE
jgi:mercuric ion transport protein